MKCPLYDKMYLEMEGTYDIYYTPTLGKVYSFLSIPQTDYTDKLVEYIRDGVTNGIIYHDSLFGITILDDPIKFNKISVYPIPASDLLTIKHLNSAYQYSFELYNISGVIVRHVAISNVTEYGLNVRGLEPGVYFLKANDTRNTFIEKIIIAPHLK